jgi:hypothetical protein
MLNRSESRTLATVGACRVVSERDHREAFYAGAGKARERTRDPVGNSRHRFATKNPG